MIVEYAIRSKDFGRVPDDVRPLLGQLLRENEMVKIIIKPMYESSAEQKALFHVYVRRISEQCGFFNEEQVKQMIKVEAMNRGYPPERDEMGNIVTMRNGKAKPLSVAKADAKQMHILIDGCKDMAYDNGFILEDE